MSSKSAFFGMVIPSVMAFALTGVYSIVDGFFVGNRLGDSGLAAINLAYPVTAFIQAIGTGLGLSGAVRYSILRGQRQQEKEKENFACTVLLLSIFSALLTVLVFSFMSPLLHLPGAAGSVYELSREYIQVIAAICMAVMFALRSNIGILFGSSAETNADIAKYLPLFLLPLLPLAYVRITTTYLYATEKAVLSYLLVYAEPVTLFFLLLLLPQLPMPGTLAVWIAVPLAQFMAWGLSLIIKRYADRFFL